MMRTGAYWGWRGLVPSLGPWGGGGRDWFADRGWLVRKMLRIMEIAILRWVILLSWIDNTRCFLNYFMPFQMLCTHLACFVLKQKVYNALS